MNDPWTPEKLARFIAVNGYDPTTTDGVISHIDKLIAMLNELSDQRDAWQLRTDLPFEDARARWEAGQRDVEYWVEKLKEAYMLLGEIVYRGARRA